MVSNTNGRKKHSSSLLSIVIDLFWALLCHVDRFKKEVIGRNLTFGMRNGEITNEILLWNFPFRLTFVYI